MKQITCILDACTIINLIHIDDENGYLIDMLSHMNIFLSEKVFKEVNDNVYDKIDKLRKSEKSKFGRIKDLRKEIDQKLTIFRGKQILDIQLKKDFGENCFNQIKELTGYSKSNGEFYSTVLALYLSRNYDSKIFFHTDDFPAKYEFEAFFKYQQIGYVEDTADLLVLLYRIDERLNVNDLDQALSNLASEYSREVSILEKKLRQYQIPTKDIKKMRGIKIKLDLLISKLSNHDFSEIGSLYNYFKQHKAKCTTIYKQLELHNEVFQLETKGSNNLIQKIKELRSELKTHSILKLDDLIN